MVELKYQKEINANLKQVVLNDSIIISGLKNNVLYEQNKAKEYKKQRNIAGGAGIGALLVAILALIL